VITAATFSTVAASNAANQVRDDRSALARQRSLRQRLLHRQDLANQPDHQQFEQQGEASGEYVDEQLFHNRQVRSRR
jgi:hypothetical protein